MVVVKNDSLYKLIQIEVDNMLLDGWDFQSRLPKWEHKLKQQETWIMHETGLDKEKLYKVLEVLHEYGVVE